MPNINKSNNLQKANYRKDYFAIENKLN